MSDYKGVPIAVAQEIANKYDKNQVIIVCWDKEHSKTHVVTYGKSKQECIEAADGGNMIKRALGWPEEKCNDKPERYF